MKAILLTLIFTNIIQLAYAEKFTSTIHSIDAGNRTKSGLVRFNNGRVTFVRSNKNDLMSELKRNLELQESIRVNVDVDNFLIDSEMMNFVEENEILDESTTDDPPFTPSIVKNNNSALKIFKKMRRDYTGRGECYNRAHIWSYEEFQRTNLNSMKIFMFFTESYIRKYKYHWWFHVTPAVYVGNSRTLKTLDRRYTSGPRSPKAWSDIFIKSKRSCPVVKKFEDFWLNQKKQHCYHIHTSMYYVIPRDIEKRDLNGEMKFEFDEKTIRKAYKDAFKKKRVQAPE